MPRVQAQSTETRIASNTAARQVNTSFDREDIARSGDIQDAATFNATAPDPHDSTCLPDLAVAGEEIRGKTVYGLTGDWDPTRPGDQNVLTQFDSGQRLDVSDGLITYGFLTGKHATG